MEVPEYDELPLIPEIGYRHSWDVFGRDDDLGSINFLTPEHVRASAALIRTGETINLGLPLTEPDPPLYGREPIEHSIFPVDRNNRDDRVDALFPQASTQWDGLRHVRCREFGFYTGITDEFEPGPGRLGIEHWADRGIVGRGVLLDVRRYLESIGNGYDPLSRRAIMVEELDATASHQGVEIRAGDILCIRIGWQVAYRALSREDRVAYRGGEMAGLSGSEEMARMLWNRRVAAIACDNPAIEMYPADMEVGALHRRLLPLLGYALGELFDFERLAEACRADRRYEFMFVSVPLNIPGGVGSPANVIALR